MAHWFGSPDAEYIALYAHGGGYTQPLSEGQMEYYRRLVKDFNTPSQPKRLAVLLPAYTLAPEVRYPHQLRELAATLSYLLDDIKIAPSKVFLTGDSAGGGLVMSLLSHLLHPHPGVREIKLSAPLAGTFIFSPWVSFSTNSASYTRNANKDCLVPRNLRRWSAMYLDKSNADPETDPGPVTGDAYTDPLTNYASWWQGMHHVTSNVLVWGGGNEVFVDDFREFDRVFRKGWVEGGGEKGRVTYVETPLEMHIAPLIDSMNGGDKKNADRVLVEAWLKERMDTV